MLQNFIISVQAVLPLFFMMMLGFLIQKKQWLDQDELTRLNSVIFKLLFPFAVFNSIYHTKLSESLHPKLIAFSVTGILLIYIIALLIVPKIEKNNASRSAMIQASYRSNFVLLGLPLVTNLYPNSDLGMTAIAIAVLIPIYNILAVLTFEAYRGGKANPKRILRNIITNPLIIGCIAGIVATPLPIPTVIAHTISQLSATATPMAIILLGATFQLNHNLNMKWNVLICTFSRLLLFPGIFLSLAAFWGFRGLSFATLLGIFSTPCSVSSFTMAQQMDSDGELAGATVIFTSIFSCFTMCFWIFIFKQFGIL